MPDIAEGVLKLAKKDVAVLRDPARSFRPKPMEIRVPPQLVRAFELVEGVSLTGPVRRGKRGLQLASIKTICGLKPEEYQNRTPFPDLVPVDPDVEGGEHAAKADENLTPLPR